MSSNKVLVYPDNLMSANEFAYIIKHCKLHATVIINSKEMKAPFLGLPHVDFISFNGKGEDSKSELGENIIQTRKKQIISTIKKTSLNILLCPVYLVRFYLSYKEIERLLKGTYKSALIATDRSVADGYTMPFYYFCKKHNIRMIIPNTAFFANKEGMLRARFSKKKDFIATRLEKLVMKTYIEKYKNSTLAYYHLPTIVTFKVFGVLAKNPWVMGTNNSAILCLDNGKLVADYVNAGVNRDKVAQIGSYKTDCYNNKSTHVDTIGFALPQMYEHDILGWEEHIEIIEGLLSGLELLEKDIVIFLHPKMDKAHYQYLEREYRCEISNQRTDLGLKHVDLYVATFSTTVFTATAYHVPSLVIDCFEAKYDMFDQYKSIQVFTDITNLLQRADGLTKNRNKFLELKKLVSDDAKRLGNEPGEGIKKLNDLIRG